TRDRSTARRARRASPAVGRVPEAAQTAPIRAASYAAPETCAPCHASLYASYRKTAMGRSFTRARAEDLRRYALAGTLPHRASDRSYTLVERGGGYVLRRHQLRPRWTAGEPRRESGPLRRRVRQSRPYPSPPQRRRPRIYELPTALLRPSVRARRFFFPAGRGARRLHPAFRPRSRHGTRRQIRNRAPGLPAAQV